MRPTMKRYRWAAVASGICLLASACGSGAASSAGGGGTTAVDSSGGGSGDVDPIITAYQGPKVDLSGVSLTVTSSEPDGLTMGELFMFGKLKQWGANVDHVVLTSTSGIQTMVAGKSDLAAQGADEVVLGNAQGAHVTAIGSPDSKQHYVLVAKKSVKDVKALSGKSIAMSGPSGFDTLLSKYALHQAGMQPNAAKFVQIGGSPDRAAALLSGTVDAATIFLAGWENLQTKSDKLHLLKNFAQTTDFPGDVYYAKADYLKANPKLALGVACANLEANDWLRNNEDQYVKFALKKVQGSDEASLKQIWQDAISAKMWPSDPADILPGQGLKDLQQAMLISGEINKASDLSEATDDSYLQKAADMGCGSQH
ncbi:MAG TPA: ABC transporter substrate-binding protein [Nocardioidaceae bacterium]|nr:ABC transporter substrate-binding protein [Nocardioidaceae bacterium]